MTVQAGRHIQRKKYSADSIAWFLKTADFNEDEDSYGKYLLWRAYRNVMKQGGWNFRGEEMLREDLVQDELSFDFDSLLMLWARLPLVSRLRM